MLMWAIIFLIIALVAGLFGFTKIAGGAWLIARILFFIAIVLFLIMLIMVLIGGRAVV
jgi:uncharacterized membrane protein YtjA (UPF0391 family)